jgi:hypothetical protein
VRGCGLFCSGFSEVPAAPIELWSVVYISSSYGLFIHILAIILFIYISFFLDKIIHATLSYS